MGLSRPEVCGGNINCAGNARTWRLSIFAATCRLDYANSQPTDGTRSFLHTPVWSALGWTQVAREFNLRKANFSRRCSRGKFLFQPEDKVSLRCRSAQTT